VGVFFLNTVYEIAEDFSSIQLIRVITVLFGDFVKSLKNRVYLST